MEKWKWYRHPSWMYWVLAAMVLWPVALVVIGRAVGWFYYWDMQYWWTAALYLVAFQTGIVVKCTKMEKDDALRCGLACFAIAVLLGCPLLVVLSWHPGNALALGLEYGICVSIFVFPMGLVWYMFKTETGDGWVGEAREFGEAWEVDDVDEAWETRLPPLHEVMDPRKDMYGYNGEFDLNDRARRVSEDMQQFHNTFPGTDLTDQYYWEDVLDAETDDYLD